MGMSIGLVSSCLPSAWITFIRALKEGAFDMDLLKLKAFPLTVKDKAKIWINSLSPRTIMNWAEL